MTYNKPHMFTMYNLMSFDIYIKFDISISLSTYMCIYIYIYICEATTTIKTMTISITPQSSLRPLVIYPLHPPVPSTPPPANHRSSSVTMDAIAFFRFHVNGVIWLVLFLCLASFTEYNYFELQPCGYTYRVCSFLLLNSIPL